MDDVKNEVLNDDVPICAKCGGESVGHFLGTVKDVKSKCEHIINSPLGFVKPDIVFFGEMLPERFAMHREDCLFSDYLVCIGTSLEV